MSTSPGGGGGSSGGGGIGGGVGSPGGGGPGGGGSSIAPPPASAKTAGPALAKTPAPTARPRSPVPNNPIAPQDARPRTVGEPPKRALENDIKAHQAKIAERPKPMDLQLAPPNLPTQWTPKNDGKKTAQNSPGLPAPQITAPKGPEKNEPQNAPSQTREQLEARAAERRDNRQIDKGHLPDYATRQNITKAANEVRDKYGADKAAARRSFLETSIANARDKTTEQQVQTPQVNNQQAPTPPERRPLPPGSPTYQQRRLVAQDIKKYPAEKRHGRNGAARAYLEQAMASNRAQAEEKQLGKPIDLSAQQLSTPTPRKRSNRGISSQDHSPTVTTRDRLDPLPIATEQPTAPQSTWKPKTPDYRKPKHWATEEQKQQARDFWKKKVATDRELARAEHRSFAEPTARAQRRFYHSELDRARQANATKAYNNRSQADINREAAERVANKTRADAAEKSFIPSKPPKPSNQPLKTRVRHALTPQTIKKAQLQSGYRDPLNIAAHIALKPLPQILRRTYPFGNPEAEVTSPYRNRTRVSKSKTAEGHTILSPAKKVKGLELAYTRVADRDLRHAGNHHMQQFGQNVSPWQIIRHPLKSREIGPAPTEGNQHFRHMEVRPTHPRSRFNRKYMPTQTLAEAPTDQPYIQGQNDLQPGIGQPYYHQKPKPVAANASVLAPKTPQGPENSSLDDLFKDRAAQQQAQQSNGTAKSPHANGTIGFIDPRTYDPRITTHRIGKNAKDCVDKECPGCSAAANKHKGGSGKIGLKERPSTEADDQQGLWVYAPTDRHNSAAGQVNGKLYERRKQQQQQNPRQRQLSRSQQAPNGQKEGSSIPFELIQPRMAVNGPWPVYIERPIIDVVPESVSPEKTQASAIVYDGQVYFGDDHFQVVRKIAEAHDTTFETIVDELGDDPNLWSKFVTDRGRVINNVEMHELGWVRDAKSDYATVAYAEPPTIDVPPLQMEMPPERTLEGKVYSGDRHFHAPLQIAEEHNTTPEAILDEFNDSPEVCNSYITNRGRVISRTDMYRMGWAPGTRGEHRYPTLPKLAEREEIDIAPLAMETERPRMLSELDPQERAELDRKIRDAQVPWTQEDQERWRPAAQELPSVFPQAQQTNQQRKREIFTHNGKPLSAVKERRDNLDHIANMPIGSEETALLSQIEALRAECDSQTANWQNGSITQDRYDEIFGSSHQRFDEMREQLVQLALRRGDQTAANEYINISHERQQSQLHQDHTPQAEPQQSTATREAFQAAPLYTPLAPEPQQDQKTEVKPAPLTKARNVASDQLTASRNEVKQVLKGDLEPGGDVHQEYLESKAQAFQHGVIACLVDGKLYAGDANLECHFDLDIPADGKNVIAGWLVNGEFRTRREMVDGYRESKKAGGQSKPILNAEERAKVRDNVDQAIQDQNVPADRQQMLRRKYIREEFKGQQQQTQQTPESKSIPAPAPAPEPVPGRCPGECEAQGLSNGSREHCAPNPTKRVLGGLPESLSGEHGSGGYAQSQSQQHVQRQRL